MILNRWGVAILQFVIFILTTYTVFNADNVVTGIELWQFGGLFVAQVGVLIVPLTTGGYEAILKVSVAAAGAAFTAIIVIVDTANGGPGWSAGSIIVVLLAVANAVAVHFGVDARLDGVREALADPARSNASVAAADPGGTKAITGSKAVPRAGTPLGGPLVASH